MLYCPHGSVTSSYESMGEIRFLEIPFQIYLNIDCLGGQSQFQRNLLCGYTWTYIFQLFLHLWTEISSSNKEVSPGQASVQMLQQQQHYLTPAVALLADSVEGASRQCAYICSNHLHVNYPSEARKRKPDMEHVRAQGDAWSSPLLHWQLLSTTLLLYWANK